MCGATALGCAHAAISAVWLLGDHVLLDTVGGSLSRWADRGGLLVSLTLIAVIAAKLFVVGLGLCARPTGPRTLWLLAWMTTSVLVGYGGVEAVVALLMLSDRLNVPADVTHRALVWHACLWDPWFLLWGVALGAALFSMRARERRCSFAE